MSKEVKYQKTIELLKHQSELSSLYESEKQSALGKLKKVVDAYNEIIDEIEDINDRYEDEHQQYAVFIVKNNYMMIKRLGKH